MKFINKTNEAFLAGLFEGDCFMGRTQLKLRLTDEDIVSWVANLLETQVSVTTFIEPNYKTVYETSLGRQPELMKLYGYLYPWFGKRRQSQLEASFSQSGTPLPTVQSKITGVLLPEQDEIPSFYSPSFEEWAYFSGYFLAEGSIAFDHRSKEMPYSRPSLHLSSTDQDVIAYMSKLLSTSYKKANRQTKAGKDVFVVNVTNFDKLHFILMNILPFIVVSARHTQKVQRALEEMQTRIDWRASGGLQQTRKIARTKELEAFKPAVKFDERPIDWEELASIFQTHPFVFIINVRSQFGVSQTPRLRLQSHDFELIEKVSKIFQKKVYKVKQNVKSKEILYSTQTEKKKYVFFILTNVLPFLSGDAEVKAREALELLKSSGLKSNETG